MNSNAAAEQNTSGFQVLVLICGFSLDRTVLVPLQPPAGLNYTNIHVSFRHSSFPPLQHHYPDDSEIATRDRLPVPPDVPAPFQLPSLRPSGRPPQTYCLVLLKDDFCNHCQSSLLHN